MELKDQRCWNLGFITVLSHTHLQMDDDSVSGISAMRHKISIIVADKHWSKMTFLQSQINENGCGFNKWRKSGNMFKMQVDIHETETALIKCLETLYSLVSAQLIP